jgi:acyl dehydratase
MAINPEAVGHEFEPGTTSWTSKDCLLYALGVGAGVDDPVGAELEFTTENSMEITQKMMPTQPVVLGGGGADFSVIGDPNFAMMVHGEQSVELHADIPVEGTATTQTKVTHIYDKGKAAVVGMANTAADDGGNPLWTTTMSLFFRGEGGFGGDPGPSGGKVEMPDRDADMSLTYQTRPDQALLYRLNGDRNPLHSDPKFAEMAGFDKPILHGLCTYGFTGRALLHGLCESDPGRFGKMAARFSSPVMPGEALTISAWTGEGDATLFQTTASDGRVVVAGGTFTNR